MKRFLLIATLACLMGSQMTAQPRQEMPVRQHKVHRFGHPARSHAKEARLQPAAQPKAPAFTLKKAPMAPAPGTLKKEAYVPYDTLLCTAHIQKQNGKTVLDQQIEYDEYGLYRMFTTVDEKSKTETRYTYTMDMANYWTSRLIETRKDGGAWLPVNKEERTINDQEQLTSVKRYKRNNEEQLYLSEWSEYDYSHEFVREGETYSPGALTRYVEYDSDGTVTQEENYAWFEPAKDYICTLLIDPHGHYPKEITKFEGNTTVTDSYQTNMDGVEYVGEKVTRYYGQTEEGRNIKGELHVSYDEYGEISSTYGEKTESKGLDPKGKPVPGQDYEMFAYRYDDLANKWDLGRQKTGRWLNDNLLEIYELTEYNNYYEYSYYEYSLYEEGHEVSKDYFVDYDPRQQLFTVYYEKTIDGEYYDFMDFYNLQNELVTRLRLQYFDLGLKESGFEPENKLEGLGERYSEWKDGQWQPRTEPLEIYEAGEYEEPDERGIYYFNEKGEPVKDEWYVVTPEDPVGTLMYKTIYTYLENEIKQKSTEHENDKVNIVSELWLKHLDDGNYEQAFLDYEDRELVYGSYYLYDVAKEYIKSYHYGSQSSGWDETPSISYKDLVTVDPETGIETRISRKQDPETNEIVNIYKTERLEVPETGYELFANYVWDTDYNTWRGEHYTITEPRPHDIPILPVHYPKGNDDYSKYPAEPEGDVEIGVTWPGPDMNGASYMWQWVENETGQTEGKWVPEIVNFLRVYPTENGGYTVTNQREDPYMRNFEQYELELNGQQQIVKVQAYKSYSENQGAYWDTKEKYLSDIEFTYNEQGYVTERKEMPYKAVNDKWVKTDDVWTDQYIYTTTQVTPTEIDEVKTHEAFTLNGRELCTAEGAAVTVYDLSGRQVAAGTGHLTLPEAGIYLVHSNGQTVKICCK